MSRVDEMRALRASIDAGHSDRADSRQARAESLASMKQSVLEDGNQRKVEMKEWATQLNLMLQGFMKQLANSEAKRQKQASHDRNIRLRSNANRIHEVAAMRKAFQTINSEARSAWRAFSK